MLSRLVISSNGEAVKGTLLETAGSVGLWALP